MAINTNGPSYKAGYEAALKDARELWILRMQDLRAAGYIRTPDPIPNNPLGFVPRP